MSELLSSCLVYVCSAEQSVCVSGRTTLYAAITVAPYFYTTVHASIIRCLAISVATCRRGKLSKKLESLFYALMSAWNYCGNYFM